MIKFPVVQRNGSPWIIDDADGRVMAICGPHGHQTDKGPAIAKEMCELLSIGHAQHAAAAKAKAAPASKSEAPRKRAARKPEQPSNKED